MTSIRRILAGLVLTTCFESVRAADWSQFRGPNGQGQGDRTDLPVKWSEQSGVVWKQPIPGRGWSSPVIDGDTIWVTSALRDGHSLHAVCVALDSGRILQNVEIFRPDHPVPVNAKNSYASPTSCVERGRVYVHFGAMGTACLATTTGDVLWRNTDLIVDHKEGPGSSPILFENLLIVNCDGQDQQYVAALDKQTGKIVWKTRRSAPMNPNPDFRKAFSTPVVIDVGGRPQIVSTGANQVNAYEPRTGRELWQVRYKGFSNVPVPLIGADRVYVVTDFSRPQLWAVRTNGRGDVTGTHVDWKLTRQVGSSPTGVLIDGRIYLATDQGVATCVDEKTGTPVWQHRVGGTFSASPIDLGHRIYLTSEQGKTTVLQPGAHYQVIAENQLDGRILATPAVAGRSLILRTDSSLYRLEDSAKSPRTDAGISAGTPRAN
jgi:outer membrane protein assembly factor BamB